jgi:DNA-binding transcriptional ArsR family regulator
MDEVFRALADPSRRLLLDRLNARNGQTLRQLSSELDMARQSASKHLAILGAANKHQRSLPARKREWRLTFGTGDPVGSTVETLSA